MTTRPATPDILAGILNPANEELATRQSLRWDYTQAGDAAEKIIGHAVAIKRSEKLASQAVVDAGQHLQAVKDQLPHGQWNDWLQTEFQMTDRTAQNMMAVAKRFADKSETVSLLQPSVLYLLAGDSVPEPARAAVVEAAQAGQPVTKATAKRIIDDHKPTTASPKLDRPVYAPLAALERAIGQWLATCELTRYDSTEDKARQCRILAISRQGMLYKDLLAHLPNPYRLDDVPHALTNVADSLEQSFQMPAKSRPDLPAERPGSRLEQLAGIVNSTAATGREQSVAMREAIGIWISDDPNRRLSTLLAWDSPNDIMLSELARWLSGHGFRGSAVFNSVVRHMQQDAQPVAAAPAVQPPPAGETPVDAPPTVTMADAVRGIHQRQASATPPTPATALIAEQYLRSLLAQTGKRRLSVMVDIEGGFSLDAFNGGYAMTDGQPTLPAAVDEMLAKAAKFAALSLFAPAAPALPAWDQGWNDEDEEGWRILGARPTWTVDEFSRPRVVLRKLAEQTDPDLIKCLEKRYRQLTTA